MTAPDTTREAHDWAALRRLAEAATPGPWEAEHKPHARMTGDMWFLLGPDRLHLGGLCAWTDDAPEEASANAAYIAAAHPAAVLALLDRAERAEAERDAAQQMSDGRLACIERMEAERDAARAEAERMREALNTPELHDFAAGVVSEAQHQRERWGAAHDAGKAPEDWFWLLGYLGGKALHAAKANNAEKALHHTISAAAALANWHAALLGAHSEMRPGIGEGSAVYPAARAALSQEPGPTGGNNEPV